MIEWEIHILVLSGLVGLWLLLDWIEKNGVLSTKEDSKVEKLI